MNRIELYRDYQKIFYAFVQNEALTYNIKEFSMDVRRFRTCATLYDGKRAVRLTFYISGRYIIEKTECADSGDYEVILDKHCWEYRKGKASISMLIGDTIYELFIRYLKMKKERLDRKLAEVKQEAEAEEAKPLYGSETGDINENMEVN